MVRDALNDGSGAMQLLERVVHEIADSQHRGRVPTELYAPKSLLLTRLYQRLLNEIRRSRRISYVGTLFDLETMFGRRQAKVNETEAIYRRILIMQLLALLDQDSRRLVMFRLMDHPWSEIGRLLGQRTGTLHERFRVALKRLRERLSGGQGTGDEEAQDETGEVL
jgi:DNA-directed RNA polymerase specialized sigma24 family protein